MSKQRVRRPPLFSRREPPPRTVPTGGWGKRQKFVRMLQRHPDEWYQYEPGGRFSPAYASVFKHNFPGLEAVSRKRKRGGGHDVYCMWPSVPNPDVSERWQPVVLIQPEDRDPEPDEFDWDDFQ